MKNIAFICNHNSCRSQIAEYIGKKYLGSLFNVYSAGSYPAEKIDNGAVEIIKEIYGDDISISQYPKKYTEIPKPDIIISMGCYDGCPFINRKFDDDWKIQDPSGQSIEKYKETVIIIENNIKQIYNKYSSII